VEVGRISDTLGASRVLSGVLLAGPPGPSGSDMRLPDGAADLLGGRRMVAITGGQSGARVLRTDDGAPVLYLKVGEGAAAGLVADEAERAAWLAGRALAARVVAAGRGGGAAWLLSEAMPGLTLGDWIKRDRKRAPEGAAMMARFLDELHALPVADCPFDSSVAAWLPMARRLVAGGQVDTDDFDDDHADWSAERVLAKVEALAHHAQGRVVVHGDFSLGNLVVGEDERIAGCLDVGLLGVGDPYRDIVIGWRDLDGFGEAAQRAFLAELGVDQLDAERRELHRALDELF
jgi:aminoglycoside 3'-phosphotransferase I